MRMRRRSGWPVNRMPIMSNTSRSCQSAVAHRSVTASSFTAAICFRARRAVGGQNSDGRRGVRGSGGSEGLRKDEAGFRCCSERRISGGETRWWRDSCAQALFSSMSIRSALPSIFPAAGFGGVLLRGLSRNRGRGNRLRNRLRRRFLTDESFATATTSLWSGWRDGSRRRSRRFIFPCVGRIKGLTARTRLRSKCLLAAMGFPHRLEPGRSGEKFSNIRLLRTRSFRGIA